MKTIRPAGQQVFAKEKDKDTTTKSGFLVAEQSADKPLAADVLAVGHDITWIHPGDTIVYKPYASTEFKLDETEYILIHEEDILGIIEETNEDTRNS